MGKIKLGEQKTHKYDKHINDSYKQSICVGVYWNNFEIKG
jgi:hypothetical protein